MVAALRRASAAYDTSADDPVVRAVAAANRARAAGESGTAEIASGAAEMSVASLPAEVSTLRAHRTSRLEAGRPDP